MKRVVIIGAASAMAKECAKLWAKNDTFFSLVVRNEAAIKPFVQDLMVRNPSRYI